MSLSLLFTDPRLYILIAVAVIYASFDTLNKRNIPNWVAYLSIAIGVAVTLTYSWPAIIESLLLAAAIGGISFLLYKSGQLGAGDGFEFVAISLLLPLQPSPILSMLGTSNQFGIPFILSVFVAAGVFTLAGAPIYYLLLSRKGLQNDKKWRPYTKPNITDVLRAASVFFMYIFFYWFVSYTIGITLAGAVVIFLLAIPSAAVMLFGKRINMAMVSMKSPDKLEEGDLIATNFMSGKETAIFKRAYKNFGRLADARQIKAIKGVKAEIPVYDDAVPLSLPLLLGVITSLLIGNILLLVI